MITLSKTHKPLHMMSDRAIECAYDDYNTLVSVAHDAQWDNKWRAMRRVYASELSRRVRASF